nr:AlpA family phage regulatory protein [Azotobacter vinelandii]
MSAEVAQPITRPRRQAIAPRFLIARDAPAYLGMSRAEFDRTVRPHVREFRIGERGVGFDREELDAWADDYVERAAIDKAGATGQQSARSERQSNGESQWREKRSPASRKGTGSGTSTKRSTENEFTRALALVTGRKRKRT